MKKLLIGMVLGLCLVLGMANYSLAQDKDPSCDPRDTCPYDKDLPCGFAKLAEHCMQFEPDEDGVRQHTYYYMYEDQEWMLIVGYKASEYVGLIIGTKDAMIALPIMLLYSISKDTYIVTDFEDGTEVVLSREMACGLMEDFWEFFDANIARNV